MAENSEFKNAAHFEQGMDPGERKKLFRSVSRLVIKVGTTSITTDTGINEKFLDDITSQVKELLDCGVEVIIVSSGAIGVGLQVLGIEAKPREIPVRQAAAAAGQGELMRYWSDAFRKKDIKTAQILLSYDFYCDRVKYLNLRNSITTLLGFGVVPIINENDCTCTNEIETIFGDNDRLSAMVASKAEGDLLVILSDIDGLYDKNPKTHDDARLIPFVPEITPEIESFGGDPTSTKGVGGMKTKIAAAKICEKSGCHMMIVNNDVPNVLTRIMSGEEIGTLFYASRTHFEDNRSRWIVLSRAEGTISIDRGAMDAIVSGRGLLPSGISAVSGNFKRGDIVRIECGGAVFAKGITDYDVEELDKIKGCHTNDIETILGHKDYDNAVRKENIALFS